MRSLREKRHRRDEGLFLAEGLRILTEAADSAILPEYIFFSREGADHPLTARLIEQVEAQGGEAIETGRDILAKLSGKENPQTVIGVYREFDTALDRLDRDSADIWIVAQSLRDPGNLGTILRTGDAVGAGGLILVDDCVDPFSVESVRATMGALFTQRIATARWHEFLAWLRTAPGQLVGTSLNADQDYQKPRYAVPTFILVGNEAQGLSPEHLALCDRRVTIPMKLGTDSLNVAVSAGIFLYHLTRGA